MTVGEVIAGAIVVGVIWLIGSFYWLRMATAAAFLGLWAAFAAVAPIFLAVRALGRDQPFVAILTIALGAFLCLPLYGVVRFFALPAVNRPLERGEFWKPWNAR